MAAIYKEHVVTIGLAFLAMSVFLPTCYAGYLMCWRYRYSGVYLLCLSSVLMSFGFVLDSVSWAILTKGSGCLSGDDHPQWEIDQAIGNIPLLLVLAGLVVLPISMFLLLRNLQAYNSDMISHGENRQIQEPNKS